VKNIFIISAILVGVLIAWSVESPTSPPTPINEVVFLEYIPKDTQPDEEKISMWLTARLNDENRFWGQIERKNDITNMVRDYAVEYNLNPDLIVSIMLCESGGNPNAKSKISSASGLWQFIPMWHPEISISCIMDAECSTIKALEKMSKGYYNLWECYKLVK